MSAPSTPRFVWPKRIGAALSVLVVLFVAIGFALPSEFEVERSIRIDAEPEQVHALLDDLERWSEWAPFEDADPSTRTTMGTQTRGVGANMTWTSDQGPGRMEITSSSPESGIEYQCFFGETEDECQSRCALTYTRDGEGLLVTWSMEGEVGNNPFLRYLMLSVDACCGPMFEDGLRRLKTAAEAKSTKQAAAAVSPGPGRGVGGAHLEPLPTEAMPH